MMKFDPKDRCGSFAEIDYLLKVKFFLIIKQNMLNKKSELNVNYDAEKKKNVKKIIKLSNRICKTRILSQNYSQSHNQYLLYM